MLLGSQAARGVGMSVRAVVVRLLPIAALLAVLAFPASAAADTNPPTVNITSPAGGSNLSGTVTVSADASDDVAVDHVMFQLYNGQTYTTIGTDFTAPYSVQFDTTTVPNCEHNACTIYATAYDTSQNASSASGAGVGIANAILVDTTADDTATDSKRSLREALAAANTNAAVDACTNGLSSIQDSIQLPAGAYDLTA